jgi:hypothetical protein
VRFYWFDGKDTQGPFDSLELVGKKGFGGESTVCPVGSNRTEDWKPAVQYDELRDALFKPKSLLVPPPPPLPYHCPACKHKNSEDAVFCNQCGHAIKDQAPKESKAPEPAPSAQISLPQTPAAAPKIEPPAAAPIAQPPLAKYEPPMAAPVVQPPAAETPRIEPFSVPAAQPPAAAPTFEPPMPEPIVQAPKAELPSASPAPMAKAPDFSLGPKNKKSGGMGRIGQFQEARSRGASAPAGIKPADLVLPPTSSSDESDNRLPMVMVAIVAVVIGAVLAIYQQKQKRGHLAVQESQPAAVQTSSAVQTAPPAPPAQTLAVPVKQDLTQPAPVAAPAAQPPAVQPATVASAAAPAAVAAEPEAKKPEVEAQSAKPKRTRLARAKKAAPPPQRKTKRQRKPARQPEPAPEETLIQSPLEKPEPLPPEEPAQPAAGGDELSLPGMPNKVRKQTLTENPPAANPEPPARASSDSLMADSAKDQFKFCHQLMRQGAAGDYFDTCLCSTVKNAPPYNGKRRLFVRSEERRVGKECRRLCRSRWSPYH